MLSLTVFIRWVELIPVGKETYRISYHIQWLSVTDGLVVCFVCISHSCNLVR